MHGPRPHTHGFRGADAFQNVLEHHAFARLGAETSECVVFEDILEGIRSAKSVGMWAWAMHDDSSDGQWDAICALADGVMFDFHDAPRLWPEA